MSNNEQKLSPKQADNKCPSPESARQKADLYEELIKEGKQVLDNIVEVHTIQDDPFQMRRTLKGEAEADVQKGPEGQGEQGRESQDKENDNIVQYESRPQGDLQSRNETEHHLSMIKKSSKLVVGCNCIKSRCLKNYCECFTQARKCTESCKCTGCENQGEIDKKYRAPFELDESEKICNCKKSNCLKKYCECFNSGVKCSSNCKCQECKNFGDEAMDIEEGKAEAEEGRQGRRIRTAQEINQINAKLQEIAKLVPPEQQEHVYSFLEYWLS